MREIDHNERIKLQVKIIESLASGMGKVAASESVGITYQTFYRWVQEDPAFASEVMKARAAFAREIIPKAIEKEPFKMLRSLYPTDYSDEPQLQINIDNRPLIAQPTEKLLKLLEDDSGQRQDSDQE